MLADTRFKFFNKLPIFQNQKLSHKILNSQILLKMGKNGNSEAHSSSCNFSCSSYSFDEASACRFAPVLTTPYCLSNPECSCHWSLSLSCAVSHTWLFDSFTFPIWPWGQTGPAAQSNVDSVRVPFPATHMVCDWLSEGRGRGPSVFASPALPLTDTPLETRLSALRGFQPWELLGFRHPVFD